MTFVEAIKSAFKNMTKFQGRSSRSEYWWFFLFYIIVYIIPYMMMMGELQRQQPGLGTMLALLVVLALFLPLLSVTVRRLHDTNRSGWWVLLGLIPLIGVIVLLVFYCLPGTPGPNKYGAGSLVTQVVNTF
ncbi:MAG: DUF805 domain-containing protein [Asticcacaulis sp.]|nr:DUF805 domain-containing protein [Asticcacaulis sp.]